MASISPGPDFVVVSQKTLGQGRKAGVLCGLCVCTGLIVHISYCVGGLTIVLTYDKHIAQGGSAFLAVVIYCI